VVATRAISAFDALRTVAAFVASFAFDPLFLIEIALDFFLLFLAIASVPFGTVLL